jgi:hypothetical protein
LPDAQRAAAERQAVLACIQHGYAAAFQLREQGSRDADRAGAGHQHLLPRPHAAAPDRVGADGQEFEHGCVIERDAIGLEHQALRQSQVLGHPAVPVHTQHLNIGAAIGFALAAGHAGTAGQVRHHIHRVAGRQVAALGRAHHFARQLVAHYARVLQERLGAPKDMHIGTAQAYAAHAQQHVAGARLRQRTVHQFQFAWGLAYNGFHHGVSD